MSEFIFSVKIFTAIYKLFNKLLKRCFSSSGSTTATEGLFKTCENFDGSVLELLPIIYHLSGFLEALKLD